MGTGLCLKGRFFSTQFRQTKELQRFLQYAVNMIKCVVLLGNGDAH